MTSITSILKVGLFWVVLLTGMASAHLGFDPCSYTHTDEINALISTVESTLPSFCRNLFSPSHQCAQVDHRITQLAFYLQFSCGEFDFLIFANIQKNYTGPHFDDDVSIRFNLEFIDPNTQIKGNERLLAKTFNIDIKPGTEGKGWKFVGPPRFTNIQKRLRKKQDKHGEQSGKSAQDKADANEAEKRSTETWEADIRDSDFDLVSHKLIRGQQQINPIEERRKVSIQEMIDQTQAKRIQSDNDYEGNILINEFTLDLEQYLRDNNNRDFILNEVIDSIMTSKAFFVKSIENSRGILMRRFASAEPYDHTNPPRYTEITGKNAIDPASQTVMKTLPQMAVAEANRPIGYKLNFEYAMHDLFTFETEQGLGVSFIVTTRKPDTSDDLKEISAILSPIPADNIERIADVKYKGALGASFKINYRFDVSYLSYFLVYNNNSCTPNNNTIVRTSGTSMFEAWIGISESSNKTRISMFHKDRERNLMRFRSQVSLESILRNFLSHAFYMESLEALPDEPKQDDRFEFEPMSFIDLKVKRDDGTWAGFESIKTAFPQIYYQVLSYSHIIKMELDEAKLKAAVEAKAKTAQKKLHISAKSAAYVKELKSLLANVFCKVIFVFEISRFEGIIRRGMTYDEEVDLTEDSTKYLNKNVMKIMCRNNAGKVEDVRFLNEFEVVPKFFKVLSNKGMKKKSTY